ncbi:angiogenic factor with G patch and FHA domains 1-like isoform X3 [Lineus longissimus]|uniref:angiogenic factor with G patch and FHA domains 1-like isoform X3 n=1 Tax=Lineus longissimus TaxID=88925 RepID=UPI002B4F6687
MSEIEKLQEEINFLKKKLFKSESDLKGSLERVASFREKYEKGLSYNKELESQLKKLSQEIQLYRSKEKDGVSIGIQVADSDPELVSAKLVVKTDAGRIPTDIDMAPSVPVKAEVEVNIADKQVEPMSLAESLKAAAEEVVQNSGYVFDEKSGMYYDYNTGYYYDNEKALYYDPASGTYFYYDHAASEYKFHSQVSAHQYTTDSHYTDLDAASGGKDDSSRKADGRERDLLSSKSRHRRKADVPDEQGTLCEVTNAMSKLYIEQARKTAIENSKAWPPCIRAMVKSSDKLDRGSLFLVTCTGATIGREKDLGHTILIEDVLISKMHAELKYNEEFKRYVVIDHASQNGTFVNGDRVCEPKVMGEAKTLFHGDELRVGSTTLELHIHPGTDTCEGCEPGLVLAQIKQEEKHAAADAKVLGKEEKELLRRKQLKNIKRKFGLENLSYVDDMSAINNPKYQDKATERRRTKGSDNPYQKDDAPASVDRAISHENKGHKLLQKMGWSEGESLGKSKQKGLKEPIKVNIRSTPQAGLGSGLNIATSLDNVHDVKKRELWSKMQQRYTKVEGQKEPAPVSDHGGWVSGGVVMDASLDDSQTETTAQPEDVSGDVDKDLGVQAGTSGVLEIQETDILYL